MTRLPLEREIGISVPISGSGGAQKRSENPAGFTFTGTSAAATVLAGCGGSAGRGGGGAGRGGGTMGGALGRLGGALGRGGGGLAGCWLTAASDDRVMPRKWVRSMKINAKLLQQTFVITTFFDALYKKRNIFPTSHTESR